jgi:putative MATE family efflux protein
MSTESNLKENKLGAAPIGKLILTMSTLPMFSMFVNALYNIVESAFVAKLSAEGMIAITLALPIQMILIYVGIGSGIGVSSLIARRLGAERQGEANSAAMHGIIIAFVNWGMFVLFGIFLARPFLSLFTDNEIILENAVMYCRIVTICSLFVFVSIAIEKILQSTGNMLLPMIFTITGAAVNIFLSWVLVLGRLGFPQLGVKGAGIACVASQFTAMCLALIFMFGFKHYVKPSLCGFRVNFRILHDIYAVGFPTIINMSMVALMTVALNAIVAGNEAAQWVLGAYFRLNSFAFMPIYGLSQGTMPIHGYNFGARYKARLLKAYKMSTAVSVGIMMVMAVLFWIIPEQLLGIFSPPEETMAMGVSALRITSIAFLPGAYAVATACLFQGLAHGFMSLIVSVVRQIAMTIPLAFILSRIFGIEGVWWSIVIAEYVAAIVVMGFYRRVHTSEIAKL